jgi:hypothetical protein
MEEGGICVWDLREAAEHHHPTEEGVTWRRQTYSTEHNCDLDDIVGPVRALAVTKATASTEVRSLPTPSHTPSKILVSLFSRSHRFPL